MGITRFGKSYQVCEMFSLIHKCSTVITLPLTALVFQSQSCESEVYKGNYVDFATCVHLISVLHTFSFPLVNCSELWYPRWKGTFTFPPGFHVQVNAILCMERALISFSSVALIVTWHLVPIFNSCTLEKLQNSYILMRRVLK
jgi:hypothetical protein